MEGGFGLSPVQCSEMFEKPVQWKTERIEMFADCIAVRCEQFKIHWNTLHANRSVHSLICIKDKKNVDMK